MEHAELVRLINQELPVQIAETHTYSDIRTVLSSHINELIKNDFDKLINYLYRIDVSEVKLKTLLTEHQQEDAGDIIAALIIERQEQKIRAREMFRTKNMDTDEEEKW